MQRENFFLQDFDNENPQNLLEKLKTTVNEKDEGKVEDVAPFPPSPEHVPPMRPLITKPVDLKDIEITVAISPISDTPVSPVSDNQVPGPSESKIVTGGESLSSTISRGEGGNQDLINAIKDIIQEERIVEEQKSH